MPRRIRVTEDSHFLKPPGGVSTDMARAAQTRSKSGYPEDHEADRRHPPRQERAYSGRVPIEESSTEANKDSPRRVSDGKTPEFKGSSPPDDTTERSTRPSPIQREWPRPTLRREGEDAEATGLDEEHRRRSNTTESQRPGTWKASARHACLLAATRPNRDDAPRQRLAGWLGRNGPPQRFCEHELRRRRIEAY